MKQPTKNAAQTRVTLRDVEVLRLAVPALCLDLTSTALKLIPLKTCFQENFKTPKSFGPTFQTIPVGTSFKPALSQHTETGQQMLQLAFFFYFLFCFLFFLLFFLFLRQGFFV